MIKDKILKVHLYFSVVVCWIGVGSDIKYECPCPGFDVGRLINLAHYYYYY